MNNSQLFLHTGNRMEDLATMLADVLRDGSGDPFVAETVLVQSWGMGRWLSLQMADQLGICLNGRFPFPREVVEEILTALLPQWTGARSFRRETMVWRIFRLLEECREEPPFRPIAQYLEGGDLLRRMQLADRLGNLFDQYLMYRPDWLLQWEKAAPADDWQGILWHRLVGESGGEFHLGHAWNALRQMEAGGRPGRTVAAGDLPKRLCVFGVSSLPPLFLQVLSSYAQHGPLHLFLLQPTDQYWGDLVSRKKQARLANSGSAEPCYLEEGHPLVASLGRQGQDLLNLLIDADFQQSDQRECFRAAEGHSLLGRLQSDILDLMDREGSEDDRIEVAGDDTSIQVHSCHSPMREVEVLHDQLLDLFQNDPTLRPRDVLVMIPEIESYAPYVQAVFGPGEGAQARIPFSVVDRRPRSAHHAIDTWFRLLELSGSRFRSRDVLSLLETPPFRARFKLTDRDVNALRTWIESTGIRWGIDAAHRVEEGLPPVAETTWQNGIDQWLLGYAMRDSNHLAASFQGFFPYEEMEGGNIERLDRFVGVLDFLFRTRAALQTARPLSGWWEVLSELLEDLLGGVEEVAREADGLRRSLAALRESAALAEATEELPLELVRYVLEKTVDDTVSRGGFLSGGVTFCTLQPMRTIPARVVCLLGMNGDAFPRRPQQLGFDRMRDDRRVGDRSVREDDRYLFLETLLSVRQTFILSYVGQSPRDLSEAPPSVLVSELLDHLERIGSFPQGQRGRHFLVRRHRLQPFHPDYFGHGRLFSYSGENAAASRRLMGEQVGLPPFIEANLSAPEAEWRTVGVRELVRFFRNPAEYFSKERLGLRLPKEEAMLEDSELFELNSLDKYLLKKAAADGLVEKREPSEWERLQAVGRAPLGTPGRAVCQTIQRNAAAFVAHLSGAVSLEAPRSNRTLDQSLGEFRLRGELGPFFGADLVLYRPAKIKPKDRLAAWIQHLAACWERGTAAAGEGPRTLLIGKDEVVTFAPCEEAEARLGQLLEFYWQGLSRPLPFFPEAGWAYVDASNRGKGPDSMLVAQRKFLGPSTPFVQCELDDPWVNLCWRGRETEAVEEAFTEVTTAVFHDFIKDKETRT